MSESRAPPPLLKHKSWSPDSHREEAWLRRKGNSGDRRERSKSVTDDDLDELRACIELGFGFDPDSPRLDPKLARTFPALELYCAVNRHYGGGSLSRSSSSTTLASTDSDTASLAGNPLPGPISDLDISDEPEMMKTRLRYWARMVACSVRQNSPIL
nr:Membrane insertase YidC [Ipomoea batatas]